MATLITLEEYLEQRDDLIEDGRWHDLVQGELVLREYPSDEQGVSILNLSRQLGSYFQQTARQQTGYACFGLGLVLSRTPDSVRFPPVSVFREGNRFGHLDDVVTEQLPALVVEQACCPASGNLPGESASENRVLAAHYLQAGVRSVWFLDTRSASVEIYQQEEPLRQVYEAGQVASFADWPGLTISIAEVFSLPRE